MPVDAHGSVPLSFVLKDGSRKLDEATWFDPSLGEESTDGPTDAANGGGSPDPSTGNKAGVEEPSTEEADA